MYTYSEIFGLNISAGSREELFAAASELLMRGGCISTVNPEILYNSLNNSELYSALSESLNIPDGIGVVRAMSRRGVKSEKFPGVELGEALLDIKPVKLAIIGGKPGVAAAAMDRLIMKHPFVIYGFVQDGYGYEEKKTSLLLKETSPDIVFVCLGSPKQEIFIRRMKVFSPESLFIALGGSADIYSGNKKRAPLMFRKMGLEWFYRIVCEPKRILRTPALLRFTIKSKKEGKIVLKSRKKALKFAKTE